MNSTPTSDRPGTATARRLGGRESVREYVQLHHRNGPDGAIVLFVSDDLDLLEANHHRGRGSPEISRNLMELVRRGRQIGAAGFLIAQVHPGERYNPDPATVAATKALRRDAADLDLPLLDHLVFTDTQTVSIGGP